MDNSYEENNEDDLEVESKYAQSNDYLHQERFRSSSRYKWAGNVEVALFLEIFNKLKLQGPLLSKRNAKVFSHISREMAKRGCQKRPEQLSMKYRQLKRQYFKAKTTGEPFEHFEALHELAGHWPDLEQEMESESSNAEMEEEADEDAATDSEGEDALDASASGFINARCKWADGEVDVFLDLITSMGLQTALLRKRNAKIFKLLSKEMSKRNYSKGPDKLRIKFQLLRRLYNKAKNGGDSFEYFEAMRKVLDPTEEEAAAAEAEANISSGGASESELNDSDEEDYDINQKGGAAHFWTDEEVDAFLLVIKDNGFFRALDGSRKRNFKTLVHISQILNRQSFKRTPHQLRNKLRMLLKRYREAKKNGLENVRILPRHFELFDELVNGSPKEHQKRMTLKTRAAVAAAAAPPNVKQSPPKFQPKMALGSESEHSSSSSCDLLRAAPESDFDEGFAIEPTPLEVLTSIRDTQKQLFAFLKTSNENFLRQQREQQRQFLQEMSTIMRQDREENFRMLAELYEASNK